MEILKTLIDNSEITKINVGTAYDETKEELTGPVELDIENQSQFVEIINKIFEDGSNKVLVDMTNISYIDSSGLWALFEGHKKAKQKNGHLVLINPSKDVRRVLDITKMSSKMKIFDNETAAVKNLNTSNEEQ